MATRKAVPLQTTAVLPVPEDSILPLSDEAYQKVANDVELASMSVEEHVDTGGDPYNNTGQYVIMEVNKAK